jgi:hypothetical protein
MIYLEKGKIMKKIRSALVSILKKTSVIVIDQLKDPKIALLLFISTALLLFLPQSILTHLGIHVFVEGKRRLISLVFFYSIKCFLAISVFWVIVRIRNRIQNKRVSNNGRPALRNLSSEERRFLAGFVFQDKRTCYIDDRNDTLDGLVFSNILSLTSNNGRAESRLRCNIQSWVWAELKRRPELLEPELSDFSKSIQGT